MRTHQLHNLLIEDSTFTLKLESEPTDNDQIFIFHDTTPPPLKDITPLVLIKDLLSHHSTTTPPPLPILQQLWCELQEINEADPHNHILSLASITTIITPTTLTNFTIPAPTASTTPKSSK